MNWFAVVLLLATSPGATKSTRLTAAAEQLLEYEKKMAAASTDSINDLLFTDVLSLLDLAVSSNPANLHARALRSQILLHHSDNGAGEYDVCYLLGAKADADFVVTRTQKAAPADVTMARNVLRGIESIPPDAIPDPPSSCDDEDEGQRGTRTKSP